MSDIKKSTLKKNSVPPTRREIRKRRRRRRRLGFVYALLVFVLLVISAILATTVFFKIETFNIVGSNKYTKEMIIKASKLGLGSNLFRFNKGLVEDNIEILLPYVEKAEVKRIFPSTLQIKITNASVYASIKSADSSYILISKNMKLLEKNVKEESPNYVLILGADSKKVSKNGILQCGNNPQNQSLFEILNGLTEAKLDKINIIDVQDKLNLYVYYDNRIRIKLGANSQIPYKLTFAKNVLEKEIERTTFGQIDMTISGKSTFKQFPESEFIKLVNEAKGIPILDPETK